MKPAETGAQSFVSRARSGRSLGAPRRRVRGRRAQRGVAALEFALVLPLLMLLLFGIVEMGFLLYDKAVITNAARAAVRQAVAFGEDSTGAAQYMSVASATSVASSGLSSMLISPLPASAASVTVTMCTSVGSGCTSPSPCTASGQVLTIAVSYPFTGLRLGSSIDPLASAAGHMLTLNASTTMNCE
ncbi:TadE/TadG family type IV pilus assembly protein [Paraburkholderia sp. EG285A]|uniref:TadE/TadG family type IV pilus assembly protein n=1 Tax=Paraburkholderia sp. EG285A TaxID=3237009 RepID=UPI0034D2BDDA